MDPAFLERDGTHVFVSPHLDDVALSCGAQILEMVECSLPVLVMTVFAGNPPRSGLTALAEWFHAICELGDDPVGTRRDEDLRAMEILGAQVHHLALTDCLYRVDAAGMPFIQETGQLFARGQRLDEKLIASIVAELHVLAGHSTIASIHVPLGIGRHVDHTAARAAAELFSRETGEVRRPAIVYYEDLPYASRDTDPTWQFELVTGLRPRLHHMREDAWRKKIEAIRAYRSQAMVLRGPNEDLEDELRRYALQVGLGNIVERTWQPTYPD